MMVFQTVEQLQDVRLKTLEAYFHFHQCSTKRVCQADIAAFIFFLSHFFFIFFSYETNQFLPMSLMCVKYFFLSLVMNSHSTFR